MEKILDRFLRYVAVDTKADPASETQPSAARELDLLKMLCEELNAMGVEATLDEYGYVMGSIPSNCGKDVPAIGFIAHADTAPDAPGNDVKPQIIENYDGGEIPLKGVPGLSLKPSEFPELLNYKGQTIITTDGTTLLGADDKAGIAEIVTALEYLIQHPDEKHGKIRVAFTPDEEIGQGADHFDVQKFGANWAYTIDGGEIGELEYENFNAALAKVSFFGRNVHPGYAKHKMLNSIRIAHQFTSMLPRHETPEHTEGYEGFYHLISIDGNVEKTTMNYIIRDHDRDRFERRKKEFQHLVNKIVAEFGKNAATLEIEDQYYNMREKIEPVKHIVDLAFRAMEEVGVEPKIRPIRGGTDGAKLSFKGLPCPNVFTGGHNFHGRYEYIPIPSMEKAMQVIVKIATLNSLSK